MKTLGYLIIILIFGLLIIDKPVKEERSKQFPKYVLKDTVKQTNRYDAEFKIDTVIYNIELNLKYLKNTKR